LQLAGFRLVHVTRNMSDVDSVSTAWRKQPSAPSGESAPAARPSTGSGQAVRSESVIIARSVVALMPSQPKTATDRHSVRTAMASLDVTLPLSLTQRALAIGFANGYERPCNHVVPAKTSVAPR
jgi:hypothetical protein